MGKQHWMQRLAGAAELYDEAFPGMPLVEIAGGNRVLVEYHEGVTAYSPEQIRVKVSDGEVEITGEGLQIAVMCREKLVISGVIQRVALNRRDGA